MTTFQTIMISLFFIGLVSACEAVLLAHWIIEQRSLRTLADKVKRLSS